MVQRQKANLCELTRGRNGTSEDAPEFKRQPQGVVTETCSWDRGTKDPSRRLGIESVSGKRRKILFRGAARKLT